MYGFVSPALPIELNNRSFIMKVGKKLGKQIKVDQATDFATRGNIARMCIEITLRSLCKGDLNIKEE